MLIQRLWGGRGGIVYCCNVYILYLKSLSFDEVTELYFFLFISINNLIPIQTICFIQVLFIPMPIPIAVLILLKINLASLKKVKLISTFFQSHKITGAFYTLSIFVEQESSTVEEVFLYWSSTIRFDIFDIKQAI